MTERLDQPSDHSIDWYGEAARLAARLADAPEPPERIGPPLPKLRQPCRPRESSFKWSPQEEKYGLVPLPYIIIADRCIVTAIGMFSCVLGAPPPPEAGLFDDMRAGRTPHSPVPDPHSCD